MTHEEHLDAAAATIGNVVIDASDRFAGWRLMLMLNEDKKPKACLANVLTALRHASELKGALRYNLFAYRIDVVRPLPWDNQDPSQWVARSWTDDDDVRCAEWMQRQGIMVKLHEVGRAVVSVAREHGHHPLREWLESRVWDAVPRLEEALPALFGVEPTAYTSAVFRCTAIAAVARAMNPGCKVDTVLMFEGNQGKKKSSGVEYLFGKQFFTDDLAEMGTKDSAMQMAGVWCIEIAELASMKRADQDKIKSFITRKVDRFRPPYGTNLIEAARSSVMVATTNVDDWGKDETGARRFWPVQCKGTIDLAGIAAARDQMWAEAMVRFLDGEQWWLSPDIELLAQAEVATRYVNDPWQPAIAAAIQNRSEVTDTDLLTSVLHVDLAKQTQQDSVRVGRVLRRLGWKKNRVRQNGDRVNLYTPPMQTPAPARKRYEMKYPTATAPTVDKA